jgi:hypothetical protein
MTGRERVFHDLRDLRRRAKDLRQSSNAVVRVKARAGTLKPLVKRRSRASVQQQQFTMTYVKGISVAMAVFIMTGAALAQEYVVGAIKISQVWTREVPPASKVAGGYMTITNTGAEPDTLTGGSVVGAGKFEVHDPT